MSILNIHKNLLVFGCMAFLLGSCKKYLDINQNPNAALQPPITGLLANVTNTAAINVFRIADWTSYYTQYLASPSAGSAADTYEDVDASTAWNGYYNIMTDLYDMKINAQALGLNAYTGVADVLMALHINMASNVWGDIPYAEAFLGVENIHPVYDGQEALYDTCIKLLDEGITALRQDDADGELDESSDFIHGGDAGAWIKTAHALKARMLNQVSKTSSYDADAVLAELAEAYTSNDDDAEITAFDGYNPWAQEAYNNASLVLDGWLSANFVNAMNGTTYGLFDPRLPLITDTTRYGDYRGTVNGAGAVGNNTVHNECYLTVGKWYSSDASPLQIITYAECKFIEAEAEFRNGDKDAAYTAYLEGIDANMQKIGVSTSDITSYKTSSIVAVGASNITLQLIFKEKYAALFLSPVTWDDMRRTDYDYKDFTLPVSAALSTFIRRMNYPSDEISTNSSNIPTVELTDHLWWDQ
ncbi:SusD/RagB family nutrient-binding outer membrane lipoprotein [Parafilimonas sp.]|uniref:SusD/RagB family nutrient-binding outer membrane lipoprotein n=1 Tax=Parafilimonas sp. TaxID=1969739 RepID=UPI0039E4D07D